ncbi:MAG: type II toxin-antitoxin system Phd/YefM family antitoxin [Burkholderiaceae bacterium]|nr:type II toxin-antitoxin system Phd/YefM family antitoxin [Burkholderiaceae bacterium]
MISVTSVQAQNNFGKLLDSAQREPVIVTRHGRAAAFIVSPHDMDELMAARGKRSRAVQAFEAFFVESDKHLAPAAAKLTPADIAKLVRAGR